MKESINVSLRQMILIIHRAINSVDKRLLNHGERVAYIMLNLLKTEGIYSHEEILEICTVTIFHDIGAYKVVEIDKLVDVDIIAPFNHAIYGALFIKHFSPLANLYDVILTHHFTLKYYKDRNMDIISKEGLLLNFADYLDRIHSLKNVSVSDYIVKASELFPKNYLELFYKADKMFNVSQKLLDGSYADEIYDFFETKILTREEVIFYSKMLSYSIDFRSEATVKHTILIETISCQIAKLCGLDKEQLIKIKIAATLHDIGKIAIPVEILEKPGKLTSEEFEIIKSHAIIGYNILSNLNIDDIRDMGTLHHEKLDGSGYPFGLKRNQISTEMEIIAIGDITSALLGIRSYKNEFSKDKVIGILNEMVSLNKIDLDITKLFIQNYDFIIDNAVNESNDLMAEYTNIKTEYRELLEYYS